MHVRNTRCHNDLLDLNVDEIWKKATNDNGLVSDQIKTFSK